MGRNFYKGVTGDNINVMIAVAAFNFKRMMNKWKASFLRLIQKWILQLKTGISNWTIRAEMAFKARLTIVDVVAVLEELRLLEGVKPKKIQVDNGSEFISKEMDRWAYEHDSKIGWRSKAEKRN